MFTHLIRNAGLAGALLLASTAFSQTAKETQPPSHWTDVSTGLMWTSSDSGVGVTFSQAKYHCQTLNLGGFKDWTLPTIDDLQKLFGGNANEAGFRVTGPLKLTGWEWSSTLGRESGEAWALDFGDGGRASLPMGDSGLNRALCVRRSRP